jgi:hypothetical protein
VEHFRLIVQLLGNFIESLNDSGQLFVLFEKLVKAFFSFEEMVE